MIRFFQSPNICRDLQSTPEFKKLANEVRDDFGHQIVENRKYLKKENRILTGFRISPIYKNMLELFCPDIISMSIKKNDPMKIYDLPVTVDEEVSSIAFEFKENK